MPSLSEKLGLSSGYSEVRVGQQGHSLMLPETLVKAAAEFDRRDEKKRRSLQRQLFRIAKGDTPTQSGAGRYYSSLLHTAAAGAPGQGMEKPRGTVSLGLLRALSRTSTIDRLIIRAIKSQARRYAQICDVPGKQKGFRVVHRRYADTNFDSDTPEIRRRCAEMEELISRPSNPPHASFADWLSNAIEEQLVLDRRCVVIPRNRGGGPHSYHLVDGMTVRPRIEVLGDWMQLYHTSNPDEALYRGQAALWRNPPLDAITGSPRYLDVGSAAYVQVIDGLVVDVWQPGEMEVAISDPTIAIDHWGYGFSALEDSIQLTILFGQAMRFNGNLFNTQFPDAILAVSGDFDDEGLEGFRRQLTYDQGDGNLRLPIVDGDDFQANVIPLRESPRDMTFVELIRFAANLKCAAYRVHPSVINVTDEGGGIQIGVSSDAVIDQAVGDGFHGYMIDQARLLHQTLVRPVYDDLIVVVEGLDVENEQLRLQRLEFEKTHMTFDEFRISQGQKPLPDKLPTKIGDFLGDPEYLQIYQLLMQAQQMEAQAQQQSMGGYEQGDFGEGGDNTQQNGQPGDDPQQAQQQQAQQATQQGWQQGAAQGGGPAQPQAPQQAPGPPQASQRPRNPNGPPQDLQRSLTANLDPDEVTIRISGTRLARAMREGSDRGGL